MHRNKIFSTKKKKKKRTSYGILIHTLQILENLSNINIYLNIPNTKKMVLDATLLNTQHYKVRIKGKVEKSRESSSNLPYTLIQ